MEPQSKYEAAAEYQLFAHKLGHAIEVVQKGHKIVQMSHRVVPQVASPNLFTLAKLVLPSHRTCIVLFERLGFGYLLQEDLQLQLVSEPKQKSFHPLICVYINMLARTNAKQ